MKKMFYILLAMLFMFGSVVMCGATSISTSASSIGYLDDDLGWVADNYGYTFVITDDGTDPTLFHATLKNTSTSTLDPLIDAFAFNIGTDDIEATMGNGNDFDIIIIDPIAWTITAPTGGGIQFDYVGDSNGPSDRLSINNDLTFDFDFVDTFTFPANPFDLWLQTNGSRGTGIGGGDASEDFGQVAVSFQRLGGDEDDGGLDGSDLLASNWEGGANPQYVIPEPATMLLLGSGLIGFAVRGKKRLKKERDSLFKKV